MISTFNYKFSYHAPPQMGIETLKAIEHETSAYIIFGSLSNVYERLPWQKELAKFMKEKVEANIPVLGICFGHQLIADAFGANIGEVENKDIGEQGVRSLIFNENRYQYINSLDILVSHHYEVKDIPSCLENLASSPECFHDALTHKEHPFIGFQGHPEASRHFIKDVINKELSEEEIQRGQKGGQKILEQFFTLVDSTNNN